jgi:hypothetical protein
VVSEAVGTTDGMSAEDEVTTPDVFVAAAVSSGPEIGAIVSTTRT